MALIPGEPSKKLRESLLPALKEVATFYNHINYHQEIEKIKSVASILFEKPVFP